jgi:hypothetical protein
MRLSTANIRTTITSETKLEDSSDAAAHKLVSMLVDE